MLGDRDRSGVVPRVLASFPLISDETSFLIGAGACRICAAVGPFTVKGLFEGGVMVPARTGKSSAFGTRCFMFPCTFNFCNFPL